MPRTKIDCPAYCLHRRSGCAYVTIDRKQHTLPGLHGSEETHLGTPYRARSTCGLALQRGGRSLTGTAVDDKGRHALDSQSNRKIKDMIERASKEYGVFIAPEDLDRDPWLLNVQNGTLDLKTGRLRSHRQADLITKLAPVDYD